MAENISLITGGFHDWIRGEIGRYTFEAVVFDLPSRFGINSGRVSKLAIYDDEKRKCEGYFAACIANYDRGWDIKPRGKEERETFEAVLAFLEALPPQGTGERK